MRYYDDYYYNPKHIQALQKNEDLVSLGEKMKRSMCKIGQKKVKLFLNSLIKKGDDIALMYRLILESENHNINAKKYRNTLSYSYKDDYYERKRETIEELIKVILEYNKTNEQPIIFGKQSSNVCETSYIVYFDLPGCEQISFHTDISSSLLKDVPKYTNKWDGKVNSTLPKIEVAINNRYKDEIYAKYKTDVDAFDEAVKLEKERIERIRKENELKRQKEQQRVDELKSKITDGVLWNDIKDLILSNKDVKIVKESLKNLSEEAYKNFKMSYFEDMKIDFPDVRDDNLDDLNNAITEFYRMFNSMKLDVLNLVAYSLKSKLIDELTGAFMKYNSGAVCDTGTVKMYLASGGNRYIFENIGGKYTVYFDTDTKPSSLSKTCYKSITKKEAKKIGHPKMHVNCYLNILRNEKTS